MYITIEVEPNYLEYQTQVVTHWVSHNSFIQDDILVLDKFPIPHHHLVNVQPVSSEWLAQTFTVGANEVDPVVHITLERQEKYNQV